jgi:hypothetical protein
MAQVTSSAFLHF